MDICWEDSSSDTLSCGIYINARTNMPTHSPLVYRIANKRIQQLLSPSLWISCPTYHPPPKTVRLWLHELCCFLVKIRRKLYLRRCKKKTCELLGRKKRCTDMQYHICTWCLFMLCRRRMLLTSTPIRRIQVRTLFFKHIQSAFCFHQEVNWQNQCCASLSLLP